LVKMRRWHVGTGLTAWALVVRCPWSSMVNIRPCRRTT